MPNSIAVISTSISEVNCTCAGIAVGTAPGAMGGKQCSVLQAHRVLICAAACSVMCTLFKEKSEFVIGEHLKTSHVHPAADVETAAQEEILGSRRRVP